MCDFKKRYILHFMKLLFTLEYYIWIYIFEAQGLKNISIKLGILVLLCTFWKYSSWEKEWKILILFTPFFLKNFLYSYTVVFLLLIFLFLKFCCSWPILIPLCFPSCQSEVKSILNNYQTFLVAPFILGAPSPSLRKVIFSSSK